MAFATLFGLSFVKIKKRRDSVKIYCLPVMIISALRVGGLRGLMLSQIAEHNGVTDKFRLPIGDEDWACQLLYLIKNDTAFPADVFDIAVKDYGDSHGPCIRVSWCKARSLSPLNTHDGIGYRKVDDAGECVKDIYLEPEVATALGRSPRSRR